MKTNKRISILTALVWGASLLLTSNAEAQIAQFGPMYKEKAGTGISGLAWADPEGFVLVRTRTRGIFSNEVTLERFSQQGNQETVKEYELEYKGKKIIFDEMHRTRGHLYCLSYFINQQLDKKFLFAQDVNPQTLEMGELIPIAEVQASGRYNPGFFDYANSPDSTRILVFGKTYSKKNEPEQFLISVYQEDGFEKSWTRSITLPYTEKLFELKSFTVGNDGTVYVVGKVFNERAVEKVRGEVNFHYVVLAYSQEEEEPREYEVALDDLFITDMNVEINSKGNIVVAGFYSEKSTFSVKGVCYFTIDGKSGAVTSKSVKEFGVDFMEQFMSEKQAAKGKELYEYELRRVVPKENGGAVLLAEQFFIRVVTSTSSSPNGGMTTSTTYYYYYNHIIVTSISPEGEIEWCVKVPKFQVTTNDYGYYSSFASAVRGDKVYLMFNDNPKNLQETESSRLARFNGKGSIGVLVTVDAKGNQTKSLLFENREEEIIMRPKVCAQMSPGRFMVFGEIRKNYRTGVVMF